MAERASELPGRAGLVQTGQLLNVYVYNVSCNVFLYANLFS